MVFSFSYQISEKGFKQQTYEKVINFQKYSYGIFLLSLVNVLREGAELVIFSLASFSKDKSLTLFYGIGLGIFAAVLLGYFVFKLSNRINIRLFFIATTLILVIVSSEVLKDLVEEILKEGLKTQNEVIPIALSFVYILVFLVLMIRSNMISRQKTK